MNPFESKSKDHKEEAERQAQQELRDKVNERFGFIKTDEQAEVYYNGNLMMVAAHLTQVCYPNGGTPDQIVNSYIQVMERLMSWFNVLPLREKLEDMLEEKITSPWAVKEQPVVPAYTPLFTRNRFDAISNDGIGK
ncbi:MAG: hypothetical protein SVY53_11720 [Chloroflexota bacterium]|nr:hypothetical protein [Chloroflexota bacterium]